MFRRIRLFVVAWMACGAMAATLIGQVIERGTLKKLDVEKRLVVVTIDGRDREFLLTDDTQVLGETGKDLAEKLKRFKEGAAIFVRPVKRDDREVLLGIKLAEGSPKPEGGASRRVLSDTSSLKPLTELGKNEYQGSAGGLYRAGENVRPKEHEVAGVKLASQVRPLNDMGRPDPQGKIVLLSIGMSNTSQASQGLQEAMGREPDKNPRLVFVNGAQGGMTAAAIQDPDDGGRGTTYWSTVDQRLEQARVTRQQVQAVWIKQADAGPTQGFPEYARTLQAELTRIVQVLPERFPNVKFAYLSSRTYGGYATTPLNPEPYAYESGFAVKWLIEAQLQGDSALNYDPARGDVKAPWLSWGPYLWANGSTKRADGFSYDSTDFAGDGTHQSPSGQRKVARLLLDFFKTDSTTRPWFAKG